MVHCSMRLALIGLLGALLAVLASGCAATEADRCAVDEDCASGRCRADGTCAPVAEADGGAEPVDAASAADATTALCTPNHDGILSRDELPLAPGRVATYRVGVDVQVNTAGIAGPDQGRVWDFSAQLTGDQDLTSQLLPIAGTWYAGAFAGATYATRLTSTEPLLGVFELTDDALLLRGVVSEQGGGTRTELVYDPPVVVMPLPVTRNNSWSTSTTISGIAQGIFSIYTEEYSSTVDAHGELITPFGSFPVLRIRTDLTRTVGALITTKRSFSFLAECYTSVASVTSRDYESSIEFDEAAELRRLAP